MNKNKEIAVLITCHNRKEKTISCLTALFNCEIPKGFEFKVYLVDDGSSDGTSQAVKSNFKEVKVIKGNGNLFWNQGMRLAWETAAKTKAYDYYLWLNDDTVVFKNAIDLMIKTALRAKTQIVVCGATKSSITHEVTYSAHNIKNNKLLIPNGDLQKGELINGNFLLVPKEIFEKVGNLDNAFHHGIGDFDYGLRVIKAGFKNYLCIDFIGCCEKNPSLPKWCLSKTPILERFKNLYSPLGYAEPIPFFIYEKRHFGLAIAIKHFISIHLRVIMPQLWKKK